MLTQADAHVPSPRPSASPRRARGRRLQALLAALAVVASGLSITAAPAQAASVTSASFTGENGKSSIRDGVLYAKTGSALKLAVVTDNTTKCVEITGAHAAEQTGAAGKTSWSFDFTANAGSGVQTVTATSYANVNPNGKCVADKGENLGIKTASYTIDGDSTGPVVTSTLNPPPNAAGWNKSDVAIAWSATDSSGVRSIVPATDSVTANTAVGGVEKTTVATDNVGNTTTGRVNVKLDKTAPTVSGSRTPAANTHGWNNTDVTASFTTTDALSGVATSAAGKTFGEGAGQSVTGTGTDVAGNSASVTVAGVNVDKTHPALSGAPTTDHNGSGWYTGDVVIAWTAADALSGLAAAAPANSTITSSGEGLTETQTVTDKAGNSTTTSSPAVKIDRTAPTTNATAPAGWNRTDQTVTLSASDGGSGVASTRYKVGDGAEQTGTSVAFTIDGQHELTYWSVDLAGNAEAPKTVTVKVDKTAPTISATQSPAPVNGWNNVDVTVSFECGDTGSGIDSCTPSRVIAEDGAAQAVVGTATDRAGNTATATHTVNRDTVPPVVAGSRVPATGNAHGWNNTDVVAGFTTTDALSGVATSAAGKTFEEGTGQSHTGTGTDVAGNSASATVGGVNVDETHPLLSGTPSTTGWSRGDVTVTWVANDALSGLDGAVPAPTVVEGEGDDLMAGTSVSDKAGNTTATTVGGIKIDRTAPNTSASVPAALANGWHGPSTEIALNGTDSLSGVAKTFYKVGTGAAQEYNGPFTHSVEGVSTITYWSTDVAGNTEGEKTLELKLDGTAPTTAIDLPEAFATGWYADSVPVAFKASDGESGVAKTFYKVGDGAAQQWDGTFDHVLSGTSTISYWSVDAVGNVETAKSHEIKVDTSVPTITGSRTPAANGFGWNNTDVTASFVCSDSQSGVTVANCTPATPVLNEGAGQSVVGVARDNVGKTATTTVGDINIDKTAPTLTGALPTTGRTASGWYKADVKVAWTGSDTLSGIDPATQPADSTVTGEGASLGATASITDKAGNTGNGSVTGVKIDRTKPAVSGATVNDDGTARAANGAGWFNSAVRVRYTATDGLSGVQEKSADTVLLQDGAGQSATGSASDNADNSASTTVTGINIDSKAPTSGADIQCEGKNNFCRGAKATIALSAVDQEGLSGVKDMTYSTDAGKTWTTLAGDKGSFDITLNRSGKVSIQFKSADTAGNVETVNTIEVKYDTVAPTVSHKLAPEANAEGWNNADTTVTFSAEDDSDGSGVDTATLTKPVQVTAETAGQVVNGEAYDLAGNKGIDSVTVKLDRTAPSVTPSVKSGKAGANGWYNGPVTVGFTATDALSGIATTPADVVLNSDGAAQGASGAAVDKADNAALATVEGIDIDSSKPVITMGTVKGTYTVGEARTLTCTATDATSGVDANGCRVTTSGGTANGVGTFTYTATATDRAGNVQTTTGTYKVVYAWSGFLQPINDTAHQVDQGVSVFKGGSTIPVKFQLRDAAGQIVQVATATWTTPSAGSATAAAISEEAYSLTATSGGAYRWDATAQQHIYNWSTKGMKTGQYYRIGVTLDDGQIYTVSIGLR